MILNSSTFASIHFIYEKFRSLLVNFIPFDIIPPPIGTFRVLPTKVHKLLYFFLLKVTQIFFSRTRIITQWVKGRTPSLICHSVSDSVFRKSFIADTIVSLSQCEKKNWGFGHDFEGFCWPISSFRLVGLLKSDLAHSSCLLFWSKIVMVSINLLISLFISCTFLNKWLSLSRLYVKSWVKLVSISCMICRDEFRE